MSQTQNNLELSSVTNYIHSIKRWDDCLLTTNDTLTHKCIQIRYIIQWCWSCSSHFQKCSNFSSHRSLVVIPLPLRVKTISRCISYFLWYVCERVFLSFFWSNVMWRIAVHWWVHSIQIQRCVLVFLRSSLNEVCLSVCLCTGEHWLTIYCMDNV